MALHVAREDAALGGVRDDFGDPRTHFVDTRGLVELRFEPQLAPNLQWLSRAHANLYEFYDALAYTPENGGFTEGVFSGTVGGARGAARLLAD